MKAQGFTKETIAQLGISKREVPVFSIGDAVAVSVRIKEGDKERIQIFEGDVIAMHKKGASSTFTVRKIGAHGVPVERIFPHHSPVVEQVKVLRHGKVRRAKLYYMRKRVGKSAQVEEKIISSKATDFGSGDQEESSVTLKAAKQSQTTV